MIRRREFDSEVQFLTDAIRELQGNRWSILGDFELLCDYLGVEIITSPAKREVVKVVPANGIDWAFSEEQQKEKK